MLNTTLRVLAVIAATVAAIPTKQASSGEDLVHILKSRNSGILNLNVSSQASILSHNDPGWANDTHRWSKWYAPDFSVAFSPATEHDIRIGLQYMTKRNISFLATAGGHGSTVTLGSVKSGVAINLQHFSNVSFNDYDKTIAVGGGALFGAIWPVAYKAGRELPLCTSCVGLGGGTIGGGHGWFQGKYGLVIDAITSMGVALWDGTIINVSATEHPDLFWALRGAGHNFGIILEFTLRTWPQTNGGQLYNADMSFTSASLEGVVSVINDIIPTQPPDLGMDFVIFTNSTTNSPQIYLGLVYYGDQAAGMNLTARFATSNKKGIQRTFLNETIIPWDQLNEVEVGGVVRQACAGTKGQNVNVYTTNLKHIRLRQVRNIYDSYVKFVAQNPLAASTTILFEIFAQEGIKAHKASETAYPNREHANVLLLLQGIFTDDSVASAIDSWGKKWRDTFVQNSGYSKQYTYVNYAHGDESLESMYGYEPWRLERLRSVKAKYDAHGFFSHFNSFVP